MSCCNGLNANPNVYTPRTKQEIATGSVALIAGLIAVVLAVVFAAGVFGGGKMYIAAGVLAISSIPAFVLSAKFLIKKDDPTQVHTLKSREGISDLEDGKGSDM